MTFAELKQKVQDLSPTLQKQLMGWLVSLQLQRDGGMEEMERRLDDKTPENWISLAEAEKRLRESP